MSEDVGDSSTSGLSAVISELGNVAGVLKGYGDTVDEAVDNYKTLETIATTFIDQAYAVPLFATLGGFLTPFLPDFRYRERISTATKYAAAASAALRYIAKDYKKYQKALTGVRDLYYSEPVQSSIDSFSGYSSTSSASENSRALTLFKPRVTQLDSGVSKSVINGGCFVILHSYFIDFNPTRRVDLVSDDSSSKSESFVSIPSNLSDKFNAFNILKNKMHYRHTSSKRINRRRYEEEDIFI